MSTVVVVRKGRQGAIGADTLTKFGSFNERSDYVANHSKLVQAGNTWVGLVGDACMPLVLEHWLGRRKRPPRLDAVRPIFSFSLDFHASLKDDYFLLGESDGGDDPPPFESSHLDCLIGGPGGIFGLYRLRSVHEYTRFYALGAGADYAMGAMRAVFDRLDDPAEVAREGLEAAADFDDSTGRPFEIRSFGLRA